MTSKMAYLYQNGTNSTKEQSDNSLCSTITLIVVCMCIPHGINIVFSLCKHVARSTQRPNTSSWVLVLLFETVQTLLTCTVVFLVLPHLSIIKALCLLELMTFLPMILKLLINCGHRKDLQSSTTRLKTFRLSADSSVALSILLYFTNGLALLCQIAGLMICCSGNLVPIPVHQKNSTMENKPSAEQNLTFNSPSSYENGVPSTYYHWLLPICFFINSLTLWKNSVDSDSRGGLSTSMSLPKWLPRMVTTDGTTMAFISAWNIGIIVAFPYLGWILSPSAFREFTFAFPTPELLTSRDALFSLIALVNGLSTFLAFLIGSATCRIHVRSIFSSLPVLLSTSLTVCLILVHYGYGLDPDFAGYGWRYSGDISDAVLPIPDRTLELICYGLVWIAIPSVVSHLWLVRDHVTPNGDKSFIKPSYDPVVHTPYKMPNGPGQDDEPSNDELSGQVSRQKKNNDAIDAVASSSDRSHGNTVDCPQTIYACATMWHETKTEMLQLMKSILRIDKDHANRMKSGFTDESINKPGSYNYETHIFFDDAFELRKTQRIPNHYVSQLCDVIDQATSFLYGTSVALADPKTMTTPYGGRFTWILPGGTELIVHLKDKDKIRHKKRWSQCMYIYYLLGYRLAGLRDTAIFNEQVAPNKIFGCLPESVYKKAQNTFILSLDGDVDFNPEALQLLLNQMTINQKVASVCGRIHPIGRGPVVWFQQFEYAMRHWTQKAAEYAFGCVLCSAGCFSLFRASALLDDEVMWRYCQLAEAPRQMVQCDQGEDRWLCTLLLQQGHRITYCAAARALTYAPESFYEVYNQRRRWMPSTIANIMDLLSSFERTKRLNDSMSISFMLYQFALFLMYALGPCGIITLVADGFEFLLGTSLWYSYLMAVTPALCYIVICLTTEQSVHVFVGQIINVVFSTVLAAALIQSMSRVVVGLAGSSDLYIYLTLVGLILFLVFLHKREMLLPAITYLYSFLPTYLLLLLYSLCNLNVMSWGTREIVPTTSTAEVSGQDANIVDSQGKQIDGGSPKWPGIRKLCLDVFRGRPTVNTKPQKVGCLARSFSNRLGGLSASAASENLAKHSEDFDTLSDTEAAFWQALIRLLLHPIPKDIEKEKRFENELKSLRTNLIIGYVALNFLAMIALYYIQVAVVYIYDVVLHSWVGSSVR